MGVRTVERKVGRGCVGSVVRGWRVSIIRRVPGMLRFLVSVLGAVMGRTFVW